MTRHKTLYQSSRTLLHKGLKNTHRRIISAGLLVVLCYVVVRSVDLLLDSLQGSVGFLLFAGVGLGVQRLWSDRHKIRQLSATEEDRLLGYLLIGAGIVAYPFCLFAIWTQALVALVILAGVACSCWGVAFFHKFPLPVFLIAGGLLPRLTLLAETLWQNLMPRLFLEKFMAWSGTLGLQAIGFQAIARDHFIQLPNGAVEVAWGCNGFYMAATMAIASLILGLFLQQRWSIILWMMLVGALLALVFNIPRIMLVTIAAVYWGQWWFDFWHGSWGGQIFVGVLFTIYYYAVMALVNQQKSSESL